MLVPVQRCCLEAGPGMARGVGQVLGPRAGPLECWQDYNGFNGTINCGGCETHLAADCEEASPAAVMLRCIKSPKHFEPFRNN